MGGRKIKQNTGTGIRLSGAQTVDELPRRAQEQENYHRVCSDGDDSQDSLLSRLIGRPQNLLPQSQSVLGSRSSLASALISATSADYFPRANDWILPTGLTRIQPPNVSGCLPPFAISTSTQAQSPFREPGGTRPSVSSLFGLESHSF